MGRMYNKCCNCGANLDPGERCTCTYDDEKKEKVESKISNVYFTQWEQMELDLRRDKVV